MSLTGRITIVIVAILIRRSLVAVFVMDPTSRAVSLTNRKGTARVETPLLRWKYILRQALIEPRPRFFPHLINSMKCFFFTRSAKRKFPYFTLFTAYFAKEDQVIGCVDCFHTAIFLTYVLKIKCCHIFWKIGQINSHTLSDNRDTLQHNCAVQIYQIPHRIAYTELCR